MPLQNLPKAATPQEWLPLIVLDTVRSLQQRPVGRKRLAQILTGSQAKVMDEFGYTGHKFYGKLHMLSQPQIVALIDSLIETGYLHNSGGELPVLTLTALGSDALKMRAALPVELPDLPLEDERPDQALDAIVLGAVAKLGGTLGRTGLAQFLTGSKVAWLKTFAGHSCYGQLSNLSQQAALNIIDALIADGRLITTGSNRPKVVLPDQNPVPIQSSAPEELKPVDDKVPSSPDATVPTPDPTLLEILRIWRTEQAETQAVPPYIIFPNKVLEVIAAQQPATPDELSEISGIGPAKLERYGEVVLKLVREVSASTPPEEVADPDESSIVEPTASEISSPQEAILAVVADLDGLLTAHGLALLITAAPDDIVPFSDHDLFGTFHGQITPEAMETHIEQAIASGHLALSSQQRLILCR